MNQIVNDKVTGKFVRKYSCNSCQLLRINGVVCHETGCTEAWRDETRECLECGGKFHPENRKDKVCSHVCYITYNSMTCYCEDCGMFN